MISLTNGCSRLTATKLTTENLRGLLRAKYPPPEWATLFEVRSKCGYSPGPRYADALVMNLYPSRGHAVHGFEMKVSRGDWLRELKEPDKSVAVQRYCDYWWILVADKSIVHMSEVPENWGLMSSTKKQIRVIKDAPKLTPRKMPTTFVASMLKNVIHQLEHEKNTKGSGYQEGYNNGMLRGKDRAELEFRHELDRLRVLEGKLKEFQSASGITIDRWTQTDKLGEAVKAVMQIKRLGSVAEKELEYAITPLKNVIHELESARVELAKLRNWSEELVNVREGTEDSV